MARDEYFLILPDYFWLPWCDFYIPGVFFYLFYCLKKKENSNIGKKIRNQLKQNEKQQQRKHHRAESVPAVSTRRP